MGDARKVDRSPPRHEHAPRSRVRFPERIEKSSRSACTFIRMMRCRRDECSGNKAGIAQRVIEELCLRRRRNDQRQGLFVDCSKATEKIVGERLFNHKRATHDEPTLMYTGKRELIRNRVVKIQAKLPPINGMYSRGQ